MADVFLARDTSRDDRLVALKRVRGTTPELLIHFTREARVGALLHHPHVVQVEDAGLDENGPFIALEFVDGVSLSGLLRYFALQSMPLPLELWQVIARDVADGLLYAHSLPLKDGGRGVLHRDMSLDNVLLSLDGVAKLGDFGLAYMAGDTRLTQTGNVKGKVSYLAPELFQSGDHSTASDVYALGIVLFRLGAGMLPFRGANEGELIRNILYGERPSLAPLRPDFPRPLATWVQQALSQRPEERPPLEALLELLPTYKEASPPRFALAQAVAAARELELPPPSPAAWPNAQPQVELSDPPRARPAPPEPPTPAEAEPLGQSVAPTERAPVLVPAPLSGAPTQRMRPLPSPPRKGSPEPTERMPSVVPPPEVHELTVECLPLTPPTGQREASATTERALPPLPQPKKKGDAPAEPIPQARVAPPRAGDAPTERVRQAVPRPVLPPDAPTPLALTPLPLRQPKRSKRPPLWLLLGALALGLLLILAWRFG